MGCISPTNTQMLSRRGLDYKAFADIQLACSGCQKCMDWGDHAMTHDAGYTALVGIDWADTKHDFCLRATGSEQEEYGVIGSMPEEIDQWARGLADRFAGGTIAVCLEQSKGSLIYALLKDDHLVLYPINPRMLAKFREALAPSGKKDDPADAQLLLELVSTHQAKLKPWRPADEHTRTLQFCVEHRRKLVQDKTRLTNRLTSVLKGYFPHVLRWFTALDTPLVCDFLKRWPTLEAVQKADDTTLRTFFQAHHAHNPAINQQRMDGIRQAIPATTDQAVVRASVMLVHALVEHVGCLTEAIGRFEQEIDALTRSHEDFPVFASLPGAGPVHTSRLISALGTDRSRYEHVEDLLTCTGIAPIMERSGKTTVTHVRWCCPTFLRQSFHEFAGQSIQHSQWAKAFYRQQRLRGKDHQAAVRSLAFKWGRIIFQLWKNRTPYHERTYVAALQRRGSPLWQVMAAQ
jgi:transposase